MSDLRTLPKFGVGQSVNRLEDPRLLKGQGFTRTILPSKTKRMRLFCARRTPML